MNHRTDSQAIDDPSPPFKSFVPNMGVTEVKIGMLTRQLIERLNSIRAGSKTPVSQFAENEPSRALSVNMSDGLGGLDSDSPIRVFGKLLVHGQEC
jgi:hypothetical protein